jgi:hypothetical protein
MDLKETVGRGVEWIQLAQDGDRWRTLVDTEGTLGLYKMRRFP